MDDWSSDYPQPHPPIVREHHTHLRKDGPSQPWELVADHPALLGLENEEEEEDEEEEEEEEEYNTLPAPPRQTLQIEDVSDLPDEDLFTMSRERAPPPPPLQPQVVWETPSEVPIRRAGILPPVRPTLLLSPPQVGTRPPPMDVNDIDYHRIPKAQFASTPKYYHRRRFSTHQATTEHNTPLPAPRQAAPHRRLSRPTTLSSHHHHHMGTAT